MRLGNPRVLKSNDLPFSVVLLQDHSGPRVGFAHVFTEMDRAIQIIRRDSKTAQQACPEERDSDFRMNGPDALDRVGDAAALVERVEELLVAGLDAGASLYGARRER
jgi:hypothetical protein